MKVIILAITAVIVGLVELIVGGILPTIAHDLNISIGSAGQLITVFALVYAISGPILLSATAKIERKRLMLITLSVFFIGNVLTYFSPNYSLIMAARVLTAMSAALVIVLAITITSKIAQPEHRAKSIGLIYMGVSSALVLGVPIGIVIAETWGWRTIFLGIAALTIVAIFLIAAFFQRIPTEHVLPLSKQVKSLANVKVMGAHLTILFMLAGHYTVYAYFAPFLQTSLGLNEYWISVCYFLFGISAVLGGALGGGLADRLGSAKSMLLVIGTFAVILFALPHAAFSFVIFVIAMMIWGASSWALTPAVQTYIIETDPASSDVHQSINNSALQIGIALGSGIGGLTLEQTGSVISTATVGAGVVVIAFVCAVGSLAIPKRRSKPSEATSSP